MNKYKLKKEQIEFLFLLLDNYLRNNGISGIYNVLDILKQLNNKLDYDEFSEIELNEFHLEKLKVIFDVNLKTLGINILKDLYLITLIFEDEKKSKIIE